jgi:high mobility group protein B2
MSFASHYSPDRNPILSKKAPRDPNAPKRNMSAYLLYQNAMRDTFKAQNPGMTFGQLAKYTSAMYAELSPEEKEAWVARAEADKARYLLELASYLPPPGYDAKGDAVLTFSGRGTAGGRRGKPERDSNAPKRNMSAYLLYQNAMRDQFRRENPGMTFGQLAKYTSAMYKCLTPEEKATWDARASEDKSRFDGEMACYVPPPGHDAQGNLIEDHRIQHRKVKKVKDPAAPKRARGSFVFFTFDVRPLIMKEYPGIKFVELGTVMGERWRALTPEEKKRYEDMASDDKVRFNNEMQKYMATKTVVDPSSQPPQYLQHDLYDTSSMPHHYADPTYTTHGYDHYQFHG